MNRRHQLENIIIGTLLESNGERNYFEDCRSILTGDMFQDETNRRIYGLVSDMNRKGKVNTDPCSIFDEYGADVLDIVADMTQLCTEWSFVYLKTLYNERCFICSCTDGIKYQRTCVEFVDYVKQFVSFVYR